MQNIYIRLKRRYDYDNGNKRCKLLYHDEKVNTLAQRQGEIPAAVRISIQLQ